jgi:spermidine synthase
MISKPNAAAGQRHDLIAAGRTRFQRYLIADTRAFGRILVTDGRIQSAQSDEHVYHESLVHPAMLLHPAPSSVLIVGGGEGATLREVLRHPSVAEAVMVDIDGELVDLCRLHLAKWSAGAFDDPRARVIIGDGQDFVRSCERAFDVAIVDISDLEEEGDHRAAAAQPLYSEAFFRQVADRLTTGGLTVVQGQQLDLTDSRRHATTRGMLGQVFSFLCSYSTYVPSFRCEWGFILASRAPLTMERLTPARVDALIAERGLQGRLQHYDGVTHQRMVSLPRALRECLG